MMRKPRRNAESRSTGKPKWFMLLEKPKRITFPQLCGYQRFCTSRTETLPLRKRRQLLDESQQSWRNRMPWHNEFLKRYHAGIKTFADIGCSLPSGAPTTIDAREALPRKSRVIAVDVVGDPENPGLKRRGIKVLMHSIVKAPLSRKVDAIRFANVAGYLTQSERRRALLNIFKSLKNGGFLLGTHEIYKKSDRGFEIIARKYL